MDRVTLSEVYGLELWIKVARGWTVEDQEDHICNEEIIGWETVPTSAMGGGTMYKGLWILMSITLRCDIGNLW